MTKTQKLLGFIKSDLGFFLILLSVIIISFSLLSPKISAQLFPFKREDTLTKFINQTKINGINPQEYWQFREFYSPGYFTFSRNGIEKSLLSQIKKNIGIKYDEKYIRLTFLVFSSPRVNSLDMLTTQTDLNKIIDRKQLSMTNVIFMNNNSLIYRENPKIMKIIFLLSNAEMQKANGFFDYQDKDKKLTEGENWLNITSVETD